MIDTVICDFCHWKGTVDIGSDQCPHCQEIGHLIPANEYQSDEIGCCHPENMQAIYRVVSEMNEDVKSIIN